LKPLFSYTWSIDSHQILPQALRDAIKTRRASTKKPASSKKDEHTISLSRGSELDNFEHNRQPQHHAFSSHPDTATSSADRAPERWQQITSVTTPLSHPSDAMPLFPFVDRSMLGDLEPRPLSLPMKLGDFFSSSGGYDDNQRVSGSATSGLQQQQQQQQQQQDSEITNAPTASTMEASLSSILGHGSAIGQSHFQAIFSNSQSQSFPSQSFPCNISNNVLAQHQPFTALGLSQLLNPISRETPMAAPSAAADYSFPSWEQQQMLSSVIGHSRLSTTDRNADITGQSASLDDATFANSWMGTGSGIQPLDIDNTTTFILHKQQQAQQRAGTRASSAESEEANRPQHHVPQSGGYDNNGFS
jgi:hypothetical protein